MVSTLDKALAKVSDCLKKSSHKMLSQFHDMPMCKDDIFNDSEKVQADLDSRDAEAQGPSAEVVASGVQSFCCLHAKRGPSDFLRYEAIGDGLVRVGEADVMPNIAVVMGQHGQSRLPDQEDSLQIFLPFHQNEMGLNQYRQIVVNGPYYQESQLGTLAGTVSQCSTFLPVLSDHYKDKVDVPTGLHPDQFYNQSENVVAQSCCTISHVASDRYRKLPTVVLDDHTSIQVYLKKHEPIMQSNIVTHIHQNHMAVDRFYRHQELALGQAGPSHEVFREQIEDDIDFTKDPYDHAKFVED